MTERKRRKRHAHDWAFKARFRRNAFGWRSGPAIQRVREAVREIRNVARKDPVLAGEGAVLFLERVSPGLERVDSSSGAIGTAVNRAIDELVPIIAGAPVDAGTREAWLERLFEAHAADEIPYIESLADHWRELYASRELASAWADRLLEITRLALSADRSVRGHFHGSMACLSALYRAERHQEIVELVQADVIWPYKLWAVGALAAMGRKADAIRYAEACRGPWTPDRQVDAIWEDTTRRSRWPDVRLSDPRTLARAARDLAEEQPAFAVEAGVLALTWLVRGYGLDITSDDVLSAYRSTMRAAQHAHALAATCERIREMLASEENGDFVVRLLRRELALAWIPTLRSLAWESRLAGDSDGGFHTSPL